MARKVGEARLRILVAHVAQGHEGLHGNELCRHRERVPQRSVRIRKTVEEIAMLVVGPGADDAALAGHDLECRDRVVDESIAER